jgi:hypothetical protein
VILRLYLDEDSSRHALVRGLRVRGADVTTAGDAGTLGKSDEEQLEWAAAKGLTLYSFNRGDFYALHTDWIRTGRSHAGIVLSRQDLSIGDQMRRLLRLIASLSAEEMQDRVEFLSSWV